MMIHSKSYQLATPARPANQTSLEPKLSFQQLDAGLRELSCRAAVQEESAETLKLPSAQLRAEAVIAVTIYSFLTEKNYLLVSSCIGPYLRQIMMANIVLNVVFPYHSGSSLCPAVPELHELLPHEAHSV